MFNDIDWSASPDHRTAVHEAGHAVIARAMGGLACGGAGLCSDGTRVGYAWVEPPWIGWKREHGRLPELAKRFAIATYAGAEAERRALGAPDGGEWDDECLAHRAMDFMRICGWPRQACSSG